ncbi:CRTAC1 family protein [Edaphobacter paludis]|uniref:CRTAC1 family protein n=1 Tax=Edaphobacter paludis TaxID=3035702 RepID=A0AAU7DC39_9BACT
MFCLSLLQALAFSLPLKGQSKAAPIQFDLQKIPFRLENDETPAKNAPEAMAGGVAIFDYNGDGRPDIFFTNGANIATLKKDSPKYGNRLFRNDGKGKFTDVTKAAGLEGLGYDIGVAVGDFDNDGHPDIFVAGVHRNTLYHNNGDGTFTDITAKAGLGDAVDPQYGPHWAVAAAWVDVNNDGLLDLFIVNYMQWTYSPQPLCSFKGVADYCHPRYYKGQPDQLFLNNGNGTFTDVSKQWGIAEHVGKGMGVGMADYDLDGRPDLFVTNDAGYEFLFHNLGNKFEEVAFPSGVALSEDGNFISGMGLDFRDFNNDGYPDITYVALNTQTFPLYAGSRDGTFRDVTTESGMRSLSYNMSGFGAGFYDFDNDGWKDLFVTRGQVASQPHPGSDIDQYNTVFRNLGPSGKWAALTGEAGLTASPAARHRGCAFGDLDGDGRVDVVATGLGKDAEIWMNRSANSGHWLDIALRGTKSNRDGIGARIKLVTKSGAEYNHMTTSVCYASSSDGPVHFGLGPDNRAESVEIHWPSGIVQTLHDIAADRILKVTEPSQ